MGVGTHIFRNPQWLRDLLPFSPYLPKPIFLGAKRSTWLTNGTCAPSRARRVAARAGYLSGYLRYELDFSEPLDGRISLGAKDFTIVGRQGGVHSDQQALDPDQRPPLILGG